MKAIINQIIDIKLSSNYQFILGENLVENLYEHIGIRHDQKVLIVSDEIVWKLYGMKIDNSFSSHREKVEKVVLNFGESEKNFENLFTIISSLSSNYFKKTDILVAVGGGVICDMAGLAAGLYMRGMPHVLVPTTTLSAIDASVGGKTAINMPEGKNIVGMFKQPSRVICDINTFNTLSDRVFNEGIAEAIKMSFINDYNMINLFEKDLRNNRECLSEVIVQAVKGKYFIIKNDEYEKKQRQLLNFGHTLGHAIESLSDYGLRHGEAIAIGMLYMTKLSEDKGYLPFRLPSKDLIRKYGDISPSQLLERILKKFNLPVEFNFTYEELEEYIFMDKKSRFDTLNLIVLRNIGKAEIVNIEHDKLRGFLNL